MKKYLLICWLFPVLGMAQTMDTLRIKEVVISDSLRQDLNVKALNTEDKYSSSSAELLKKQAGVNVTKRSVFAEEPIINAFKYDQVNVIKNDGAKANSSCPNHMDPATTRIAPNEINNIEFVLGPYELRFGQIMGGLVRFIADENESYQKFTLKGSLGGEYHSNGNGVSSGLNLKGGDQKYDFKTFFNYRKFGNYKSGDGTEIASSFDTYAFGFNTGYKISDKHRISADWSYSRANDVMHAGLPMDADFDISNMLALDYAYLQVSDLVEHFKIKLYASDEDHVMTNIHRPNAKIATAFTPVESQDFGGRMELKLNMSAKLKLFVGTDFVHSQKDGTKEVTMYKNVCTTPVTVFENPIEKEFSVWQNSFIEDVGLFTQFKFIMNNKVQLKAGARVDYITSDVLDVEKDFELLYKDVLKPDDELNWNAFLNLKYQLTSKTDLQLSLGRGTRNASLLEKYINHFSVGLDAYEYVGNPELDSEINNQVDLTMTHQSKSYFISGNVFYSRIHDYITAEVDTSIARKFTPCNTPKFAKRFVNAELVDQYGFKLSGELKMFKYYYLGLNVSYIYATNLELDEALAEVPPFIMSLKLGYKKKKLNVELVNDYQAEQRHVAVSLGEAVTPSFYLLNFNFSYKIIKGLSLGFAVDNIFNQNYYQHLSRPYKNMTEKMLFYEPGRNFRIKANYTF